MPFIVTIGDAKWLGLKVLIQRDNLAFIQGCRFFNNQTGLDHSTFVSYYIIYNFMTNQ